MRTRDERNQTDVRGGAQADGCDDTRPASTIGREEVTTLANSDVSLPAWRAFDPARTGAVVENYHDAILVIDSHNRIALANRQARLMTGYKLDQLLGKDFSFLVPERFRSKHSGHVRRYRDSPRTRLMGMSGMELFLLDSRGQEKPVTISLTELEADDGGVDVVVGIKLKSETIGEKEGPAA